ncbi:MAG: LytTR family DNA-binding domain-containing protein [Bacteroidota bacterium]
MEVILIVEDEPLIARRLQRMVGDLVSEDTKVLTKSTIDAALHYIDEHPIDLMLLDLNLNGKNGFDILQQSVAGSFHTIIISAYQERAIQAFEFGVLDFIGKPFKQDRLEKALNRFRECQSDQTDNYLVKLLAVKKNSRIKLIEIKDIRYIKGCGIYSELFIDQAQNELHDKTLNKLETILPDHFLRIHKSYIVNIKMVKHLESHGSGKYNLTMNNDDVLPISRNRYKDIKSILN